MGSNPFTGDRAKEYDSFFKSPFGRSVKELEGELLLTELKGLEGASLVEIGCGTGVWMEFLKERGFKEPVGVDISRDMLKVARKKGLKKLVEASACRLPFRDNTFDGALFITSLEFIVDRKRALLEAARVSRDFIIIGFLNAHSLLALHRRVRALFKESSYSRAHFLTREELLKLTRWVGEVSPYSLIVESFKTTLNFSIDGFVAKRLERAVGGNLPTGGFGLIRLRVVKRNGAT